MRTEIVFVLGAPDPEMSLAEELLTWCEHTVVYATGPSGERVTPREAYSDDCHAAVPVSASAVYLVECAPALSDADGPRQVVSLDHHRPGDHGYGKSPREAVAASSLGQLIERLAHDDMLDGCGWKCVSATPYIQKCDMTGYCVSVIGANLQSRTYQIPHNFVVAAAADHCLGAAFAGEVPWVSGVDVRHYRAACAQSRPCEPVSCDEYQRRFDDTYSILCARRIDDWLIDLRSAGHLDELPDVACYLGVGYLQEVTDSDGRRKIVVGGRTSPGMVEYFMRVWASEHKLTGVYGDPARGFAGGYLPE